MRQQALILAREAERRKKRNRLAGYRPYPKQQAFHAAGAEHRERLFMAGNQLGKTLAGSFEWAMHLTGLYPDWWEGRRFDAPVRLWAAGETRVSTRDTVQKLLVGEPEKEEEWGSGAIPGALLKDMRRASGVANALDSVTVAHRCGGISTLLFKAYEQGRAKWQGDTLHGVWFDEGAAAGYLHRGHDAHARDGWCRDAHVYPAQGHVGRGADVSYRHRPEGNWMTRHVTRMTIEDAEHYTPEQRAAIIASYPPHERRARAEGIPTLGSGRVFPVDEDTLKVRAFDVPESWAQIGGLDFGWDHPTAACRLAWDRDSDVLYVTACYALREATPVIHAAALKPWGAWLPWAWPHDGLQHDKGSGEALAEQYRRQGLTMLPERATFENGSSGLEAGVTEMLDRMQTGRWKVFDHLEDWFAEFRLYHRKDGLVVKLNDDRISAARYAMMMKRFAAKKPSPRPRRSAATVGDGGWMS